MPTTYEIQIKQRGGKWTTWAERATHSEIVEEWARMPSVRRIARCRQITDGIAKIIAKYEPPKVKP